MIDLDGISINVPWSELYCDLLAYAQARYFSGDSKLVTLHQNLLQQRSMDLPRIIDPSIAAKVDWEAFPFLLGWHSSEQIEQLIHREWLDTESNEFTAHQPVFASLSALHESSRIFLGGAGVGRLGQELLKRDSLKQLLCTDLSYMALASARQLILNRSDNLATTVSKPREELSVAQDKRILQRDVDNTYVPGIGPDSRISFSVVDCYSMPNLRTFETIILSYLLDVPPFFDTMLLRVIEHMKVGQRLVFLTNITSRRDPRPIYASLVRSGLLVEELSIERLPYSLSKHDYTHTQSICPTLVVQARIEREFDANQIRVYPITAIEKMIELIDQKIVPDQRFPALPFRECNHLSDPRKLQPLLESAFSNKSYQHFRQVLENNVGTTIAESLISYMCSRYMIMITCVRGT